MDEVRDKGVDEGMDRGAQLTLFTTGNPTLVEALNAFCEVDMPGRNFTEVTRRDIGMILLSGFHIWQYPMSKL